jgi:ABC-type antimicrobial peptide transport system permease subunit
MEDEYDPKEIIENSDKYLHQTIEEARNILSKNAPETLKSLDSLLRFMKKWTISNNNTLLNYVETELGVNKKLGGYTYYVDQIILHMLDNYFMAGIVGGISEYIKKLDPKEPDYNKKVNHIIDFILDLTGIDTFYTIYTAFLKKAVKEKESESKEKYSLKDYDNILQKISNYLMNMVENLLEDPVKNREQFYKSLLGIKSYYMRKLTESLSKTFRTIRDKFYQDDIF